MPGRLPRRAHRRRREALVRQREWPPAGLVASAPAVTSGRAEAARLLRDIDKLARECERAVDLELDLLPPPAGQPGPTR
jgi:hypothetical protein